MAKKKPEPTQEPMLEEPKPETKRRRITHRLGCAWTGKDGVSRRMEMDRLDDGDVGFSFITWWDGEDKPAMETPIALKLETFNVLQAMISEYAAHRDRYAISSEE